MLNTVSTIGSFLLGLSVLPFLYNIWKTATRAPMVGVEDPWGYGRSLEWATVSAAAPQLGHPSTYPLRITGP